ncbi:MAG: hypothetical protein Edafosvirus10_15 [Edafosvirus sp.]|uniref:Uncharacterized protein n=1 Tax=Edafosvirus sp. TaxID=2487765 RepID=A0A3G4ZTV2_9VIRU|nr:MAG: hypothetical protein Edafosvirus10_15 [Edafosvirus sp.]
MSVISSASTTTKDKLEAILVRERPGQQMFHRKAYFKLTKFDDVTENLKLLDDLVDKLKKNKVRWLLVDFKDSFTIPQQISKTCTYEEDDRGNQTHVKCIVNDFDKFYKENLKNLIKLGNINVTEPKEDDGWIQVVNLKKLKRERINKVRTEVSDLKGCWVDM